MAIISEKEFFTEEDTEQQHILSAGDFMRTPYTPPAIVGPATEARGIAPSIEPFVKKGESTVPAVPIGPELRTAPLRPRSGRATEIKQGPTTLPEKFLSEFRTKIGMPPSQIPEKLAKGVAGTVALPFTGDISWPLQGVGALFSSAYAPFAAIGAGVDAPLEQLFGTVPKLGTYDITPGDIAEWTIPVAAPLAQRSAQMALRNVAPEALVASLGLKGGIPEARALAEATTVADEALYAQLAKAINAAAQESTARLEDLAPLRAIRELSAKGIKPPKEMGWEEIARKIREGTPSAAPESKMYVPRGTVTVRGGKPVGEVPEAEMKQFLTDQGFEFNGITPANKKLGIDETLFYFTDKETGTTLTRSLNEINTPEKLNAVVAAKRAEFAAALESSRPLMPGSVGAARALPKYAGSINLERFNEPYDVREFMAEIADANPKLMEAASRPQTFQKIQSEAAEYMGLNEEKLLRMRGGRPLSPRDAVASREILAASAEHVLNLRNNVAAAEYSDEALAKFRLALERHSLLQAKVSQFASSAGRTLASYKIPASAEAVKLKNWRAMVDALGGRELNEDIARYMAAIDPTDYLAVNTFIREVTKTKVRDKLYYVWLNGLLSNPATHAVNVTSNALVAFSKPLERATAATIEAFAAPIARRPREIFFSEVPIELFGLWNGLKEGTTAALSAMVHDLPVSAMSKLELRPRPIKGATGAAIGVPTRLLQAEDEFFKAIIYRTEINAMATRQALKEHLEGDAFIKRVAELRTAPEEWMTARATEEAQYRTFQKELGAAGRAAMRLREMVPGGRYIVPFVKTPVNIVKFGIERTPLEFLQIGWRVATRQVGPTGELSEQAAKATLGTIIASTMMMASQEGYITGGGFATERMPGITPPPYSIKVGDKYYAYNRLEPIGTIIGIAADVNELWQHATDLEKTKLASAMSLVISQNILSKTWVQGLSSALNALSDPERYGEHWLKSTAGSIVPGASAGVARAIDPTVREAQDVVDAIKARLAGLSEEVTPLIDIWGNDIKRPAGITGTDFFSRLMSPIGVIEKPEDPVNKEVIRLVNERFMSPLKPPKEEIAAIRLTPEKAVEFQREAGRRAYTDLQTIIQSDEYKALPEGMLGDAAKAKMVSSIIQSARDITRARFLIEMIETRGENFVQEGIMQQQRIAPKKPPRLEY